MGESFAFQSILSLWARARAVPYSSSLATDLILSLTLTLLIARAYNAFFSFWDFSSTPLASFFL
jgi:hypothetical protein